MARAKLGDVFLVKGLPGYAYIQYIRQYDDFGPLVRVFSTIHDEQPELMDRVRTPGPRYFYPLDAALKAPALIQPAGNAPLGAEDQQPVRFRSHSRKGPWQLYEEGRPRRTVAVLSEEESSWDKMYAMISQQTLIDSILTKSGLRPDQKRETIVVQEPGGTTENDNSQFFIYFSNEADAIRAASAVASDEHLGTFASQISRSTSRWLLRLCAKVSMPTSDIQIRLIKLAADFGGLYDGFEIPVIRTRN